MTFFEADALSAFLRAYFESNDSGLSSSTSVSHLKWIIFTGLLNTF